MRTWFAWCLATATCQLALVVDARWRTLVQPFTQFVVGGEEVNGGLRRRVVGSDGVD